MTPAFHLKRIVLKRAEHEGQCDYPKDYLLLLQTDALRLPLAACIAFVVAIAPAESWGVAGALLGMAGQVR